MLGETLDSILELNYHDWECLVIDDGSDDHTAELMEFYIKKDNRFKYLQRPSHRPKGANACRNFGFENSRGIFINFFDSDDLIHPDKLTLQLDGLQTSDKNFSVCEVNFFRDTKYNLLKEWQGKINSDHPLLAYVKEEISWLTTAVLWKRSFLEKQDHIFDEDLQASQEWEFHIRVLNDDPEYLLMKIPLVFMRKHEENISYSSDFFQREWNYFLARFKVYTSKKVDDNEILSYLRKYLLDHFKEMVRKNNPRTFKAYKMYVLPEENIRTKAKIYGLFSLLSFRISGKGNMFLNKVKLKK